MKTVWIAAIAAGLALPAMASNMGFKLERSIAPDPFQHQVLGLSFSNSRVATITVANFEDPDQYMNDVFALSGCSVKRVIGVESIDSCRMAGDSRLACTKYTTTCALVGATSPTLGFKASRLVDFMASRSGSKALEFWDGVFTLASGTLYLSVEFASSDAEAHATVSSSTTLDAGVLNILSPVPKRFIDIPIYSRPGYAVSKKVCSPLLTSGGCPVSIRKTAAASGHAVFEVPSLVKSFP